jgi:hypothetical protein
MEIGMHQMAGEKLCQKLFFSASRYLRTPGQRLKKMYLYLGGKGMFLCFYALKIVPVDTISFQFSLGVVFTPVFIAIFVFFYKIYELFQLDSTRLSEQAPGSEE